MNNEKQYIVNMGFEDDYGRRYNSGQRLTQAEYNLLPMNQKVRCSEDFQLDRDNERYDLFTPKP